MPDLFVKIRVLTDDVFYNGRSSFRNRREDKTVSDILILLWLVFTSLLGYEVFTFEKMIKDLITEVRKKLCSKCVKLRTWCQKKLGVEKLIFTNPVTAVPWSRGDYFF